MDGSATLRRAVLGSVIRVSVVFLTRPRIETGVGLPGSAGVAGTARPVGCNITPCRWG